MKELLVVSDRHPYRHLVLALLCFIFLQVPFLGAPFRIDEPNILAIARQIAIEPLNPYGFEINWLGHDQPAWEVLRNPPLVPYWLALWGFVFGWSEISLHSGMLLWALAACAAVAQLDRYVREQEPPASLPVWLCISSPVFFVSAPLLMPDVVAVALGTSAVALCVRGYRHPTSAVLFVSFVLAFLAPLAKFTALSIVLPLAVLAAVTRRDMRFYAIAVAPLLGVGTWDVVTRVAYGTSHLLESASAQGGVKADVTATAIAFGMTVAPFASIAAAARNERWFRRTIVIVMPVTAMLMFLARDNRLDSSVLGGLFAGAGLALLLAILSRFLPRMRDPVVVAMMGWLGGALALTTAYQFVTSRYMLLAIPPLVILTIECFASWRIQSRWIAGGIVFSLLIAASDRLQHDFYPAVANRLIVPFASAGTQVWYIGHWGFQEYGERAGARPLNLADIAEVRANDVIVMSEASAPDISVGELEKRFQLDLTARRKWLTAWPLRTQACGPTASFHGGGVPSCLDGLRVHLPVGFSREPLDTVHVWFVMRTLESKR